MKIVFTGGGTAGHIMPNVALIEKLKGQAELFYIGSSGMEKEIISRMEGVEFYQVDTVKLVRKVTSSNLLIPFRLLKSVSKAKEILSSIQPDVVFSKGGYVALPSALAAKCKLILHESDLTLGLSNRLVKNKASVICTSFDTTAAGLKNGKHTGCPIRPSLYRPKVFGSRPQLLVMGGSQGAQKINQVLQQSIDRLTEKFDVIHLTGRGKATQIKRSGYFQEEFCHDMASAYAKTSVAITRAGGGALFELAALKIPAVAIPLPKGTSRGDQVDNADYFEKKGLIKVLTEQDLTADALVKAVFAAYTDRTLAQNLAKAQNIDAVPKILPLLLTP